MSCHGFNFFGHRIRYDLVFLFVHHGVERVTGDHDFTRVRLASHLLVKHLVDVAIDHHKPEHFFGFGVVDGYTCQQPNGFVAIVGRTNCIANQGGVYFARFLIDNTGDRFWNASGI